jgi:hypothetical protein
VLVVAVVPFIAACAAPAAQPQQAQAQPHCVREYPVGSALPVTRCRTEEDKAQERSVVESMKESMRPTPPVPKGGAGS